MEMGVDTATHNRGGYKSVLNYPLELSFKIATIGTRVRVVDAAGRQVAYLRKKKFRLREDVRVYEDEDQKRQLFRIRADRVVDFGASYTVSDPDGRRPLGAVRQRGVRSIWKSTYEVSDANGKIIGVIHEENPFVKVLDNLAEALPFADALGGLFFNPAYLVDLGAETVLRMQKERSVFESRFRLDKLGDFSQDEEELLLASLMMVLLLERDRG
jgi:hypothetical protein